MARAPGKVPADRDRTAIFHFTSMSPTSPPSGPYKVLKAPNGTEAIAVAQGYADRIDLLLTDVEMPGMNGSELAKQLELHNPEMKVLLMPATRKTGSPTME